MHGALSYLFRRAGSHVFLCAADPAARYEVACGKCGYPVKQDQQRCPRCRQELEECPCCSALRHVRPPKPSFDPLTEIRTCPVCKVRRAPFGRRRHNELDGSFCTNIYGCPVGGLLLSTGEFALLPAGASRCPLCEHATLKPLAVQSFQKLVNRCLFCRHCFGSTYDNDALVDGAAVTERCVLCGRRDRWSKAGPAGENEQSAAVEEDAAGEADEPSVLIPFYDSANAETRSADQFRILVAAARALVRHSADAAAEAEIFRVAGYDRGSLSRIVGDLMGGTHDPVVRRILESRIRHLIDNLDRLYGREPGRMDE